LNTGAWTAADGYMQPNGYPIIKGFLKIEEQISYGSPCGTWKDVTVEVLSYGYVGRNINPVPQSLNGTTLNPQWTGTTAAMDIGQAPAITNVPMNGTTPIEMGYQNGPTFPNTTPVTVAAGGAFTAINTLATQQAGTTYNCLDPHPLAVVTLGTPATNKPLKATVGAVCGVEPSTGKLVAGWTPTAYDFWPNTLFD